MKRSLWILIVALFATVAMVGFSTSSSADEDSFHPAQKKAQPKHGAARIDSRSYRSSSGLHKIIISSDENAAIQQAREAGATEIADYGSYKLFVLNQPSLQALEEIRESEITDEAGLQSFKLQARGIGKLPAGNLQNALQFRDDFNVLLLRSGAIDTTEEAGFTGIGKELIDGVANQTPSPIKVQKNKGTGTRLRLLQFAGPVKQIWMDELRASGLEVIAYVPNNAYLVREDAKAADQLDSSMQRAQSRGEAFVQWMGDYKPEYKIHPNLVPLMTEGVEVQVAVQIAKTVDQSQAQDVRAVRKMASSIIADSYTVLNFTNLKISLPASRISELAVLPNVVNIERWSEPRLFDERASQIVAGELMSDGKEPKGSGYMSWLQARGFASRFDFAIDVTDTGVDRGSLLSANLHSDFKDISGQSRLIN
jgi:hypothetical protein